MTAKKHPDDLLKVGRPTDYRPEYCNKVIEWGKLGKSKAWIAASLLVTDQTLRNWSDEFPEFLEAMEISQRISQKWWEDTGQTGMMDKSIDASIWSRSISARFPNDWREKSESKQTVEVSVTTKEQRDAAFAAATRAGK